MLRTDYQRNTEKFTRYLTHELAVHGWRHRSRCHGQRWLPVLEKKHSLTHSRLFGMCVTTPETSEKLNETVYTTCAWLGRRKKFDIAATKWRRCKREDKRSYGGSREDAGHSPSSTLIARHRLMSVSS